MNWLSHFFDTSTEEPPAPRKRLARFRHYVKTRRKRAKSAWKKLSSRTRQVMIGVCAIAFIASGLGFYFTRPTKAQPTVYNLFPPIEAPTIPKFDEEVLVTDRAAPKRRWKYIVIHHSASTAGSAQSFDQYHREENHWRSLGYHFVVGNGRGQGDGIIAAGPRWFGQEAGAHAHSAEHNEFGIGICLVGNFDAQPPSPAQWHALVGLVRRLCAQYDIPARNIFGHNQIRQGGSTACPGKNLNLQLLREAVE